MKRDFLEGLGLNKEAIDAILDASGSEKEKLKKERAEFEVRIAALKEELNNAQLNAEQKINAYLLDAELSSQLKTARVRNPKAVMALLDMESIKIADGMAVGLSEQLDIIKAENSYLFDSDKIVPEIVLPTPGASENTNSAFISGALKAAGLK